MKPLPTVLLCLASVSFAGREAIYTASKGDVSQTLVMRRLSSSSAAFTLRSENAKVGCHDEVSGEAVQDPLAHPGAKGSGSSFAAEEYVYRKGNCRITFRVDMESATMVKVVAACPEHRKPRCPLEIPETLRLRR